MDRSPVRGAARLAAILDSLPEALLLIDPAGRVVNANAVALGWFEGNGAPLVGQSVTHFLSGFGTALARVGGDAGTGGMWADPGAPRSAPGSGPERMVAKLADGSAFPAEITRSFLPREHGGLEVVVVRDVSGVADAEQELRRQQKQTELILRAATEGIVGVDLGGRVVLVNPAAARILKYRASELGGMEFERLVRGDSPVAETLRTGRKHRLGAEAGVRLVAKDGETVPVELSTAPVLEGDALVGAVVTFVDISRFRLPVPAGSRGGDADRGMVAAGSVSALRRPLDAARGELARLAASGEGLSPSARHHLAHVTAELAEAARLVDELLDAATGMADLRRRPAELGRIVHAAVDAATDLAAAAGIDLAVHTGPAEVVIDGERLTQAVRHLLVDTVQASPGGSTVVVAAARRGAIARIEIRGVEIGSEPEHLGFARVVVERHGGAISVHRVEGKGVTYVIELPAGPGAEAEMAAAPPMNRALVEETRIIPIVRDTGPVALGAANAPALAPAPVPVGVPAATLGRGQQGSTTAGQAVSAGAGGMAGASGMNGLNGMTGMAGGTGMAAQAGLPTRPRLEPVGAPAPRPQHPMDDAAWFREALARLNDDEDDDPPAPAAANGRAYAEHGHDHGHEYGRASGHEHAGGDGFRAPANGATPRDFDLRGYAAEVPDSAPTAVQPAVRLDGMPPVSLPLPQQPAAPAYAAVPAGPPQNSAPGYAAVPAGPPQNSAPGYAVAQPLPSQSAAPTYAAQPMAPQNAAPTYAAAQPVPAQNAASGVLGVSGVSTYGPTQYGAPVPSPMPPAAPGYPAAAPAYGPAPGVTTYTSAASPVAPVQAPMPVAAPVIPAVPAVPVVPSFPARGLAAAPAALGAPTHFGGESGFGGPQDADDAARFGRRRAGETGQSPLAPPRFGSAPEPAIDDTFLSAYQAPPAQVAPGYPTPGGQPAPAAPGYPAPAAQPAQAAAPAYQPQVPQPAPVPQMTVPQMPAPQAPSMAPAAPQAPMAPPAPQPMPTAPPAPAPAPATDNYLIQHVEPKPAATAAWPDPGEPDPEPAPTQPDPYAWNPGTSGSGPLFPAPKLLVWPAPEQSASELLQAQGYDPSALKAPAQLQAVGPDRPVALLADPVGVPVTRAALHTLRAAAADSGIPLFVTAGLGAVPAAALPSNSRRGADPSVLLRALTPEQVPNPRVLLIEENPELAAAFAISLERDGMRVVQAATENDALSSLSAEHPQLVVMNLTLVRRRRSGVVDWLRAYERLHLAPTVLYTAPAALTADAELMRALRAGAAAVHLTDRETGQEAANRLLDLMGKVAD